MAHPLPIHRLLLPYLVVLTAAAQSPLLGAGAGQAHDVEVIMRRGEALEKQLRSREALHVFLEAERRSPRSSRVLVKIAKQYSDLINDEQTRAAEKASAEKSVEYARKALVLAPDDPDANLAMAVCYCKLTPYISAQEKARLSREIKKYAERAIALNPRSDYAHHLLGRWHQEMSSIGAIERGFAKTFYGGLPAASLEEALARLDHARALRPDRLLHQVEYGRTLIMMGRKEEGRRELERGLAMPSTEKDDPETKDRGRRTLAEL